MYLSESLHEKHNGYNRRAFGSLILDPIVPAEQLIDEVLTLLRCYLGTDVEEQKQK